MRKELNEEQWYSVLETYEPNELVDLFNEFAQENSWEEIWSFDDYTLEELLAGKSPYDIFMMGCNAEIGSYSDDYLMFDGNGNIVSYSTYAIKDFILETSLYDMVDWLNENKSELSSDYEDDEEPEEEDESEEDEDEDED